MSKSSHVTVHMIGHGHIDPTWLWRWTEGYEEVRATFRSALDRMNETPDFRFTASSACFYAWVKACDPELFEQIRARVNEGRWEIAGGWWIEPDCNIPSGESFVRQGLYAQRFFDREFGKRATAGFNPDSFGHAGTLPQIYSKLGMDCYVYMRPDPVTEMRYPRGTSFWWEANDGSRVFATVILESYNADEETRDRIDRLVASPYLNDGQSQILGFYGVGNHGGGPTKRAIAQILDAQKDKKAPHVVFSTLRQYVDDFQKDAGKVTIPVVATDLQHHAQGCYTTHAEIKRLNRAAEHALMSAERFATVAWLTQHHPYPQETLEKAWKDLLYNQFHDILAGTSLESSYADSRDQIGAARHAAHVVRNESLQVIARSVDTTAEGNTILVVNPLPWPVRQVVLAPPIAARTLEAPLHIAAADGTPVLSQPVLDERIGSTAYAFAAETPALGYCCYHMRPGFKKVKQEGKLKVGRDFLENKWWRIEFDPYDGHICRLVDRKRDTEVLRRGNVLAALVDSSDTWGHDFVQYRNEAGRFGGARLSVFEEGPVRAAVRAQSGFNKSSADVIVSLYRNCDAIDCVFKINWQERYTMLKVAYETCIQAGEATYDTAYGCQTRDTQGNEEPGQKWLDLTGEIGGERYGLALLNDSKYGFDVRGGTMRVTMLRSPAYAHHDPAPYDSSQPFAIMDQGWHTVRIRLTPHAGTWKTADVCRKSWELNEPLIVHVESAHAGQLGSSESFLDSEAPNVVLTVFKKSEDGDDVIVRGYETAGKKADTVVRFPHSGRSARVTFLPHEIKTLRFPRDGGDPVEVNLLEEPMR